MFEKHEYIQETMYSVFEQSHEKNAERIWIVSLFLVGYYYAEHID